MKRKLNWFDISCILIVLVVVVAGFLYMNRSKGGESEIVSGKKTITFIAEAYKVNPDVCSQIKVGDQLVAVGKYQDAYVKEVYVEDTSDIAAKDGQIIQINDATSKRLVVTIEAKVNQYGPYMDFGGQEIKSGVTYWIKTDKVSAFGFVVKILDNK